jgi:acetoacetyl-CoA synthetase
MRRVITTKGREDDMAKCLWQPSPARVARSNMVRFMEQVNARHGLQLTDYPALYQWSVTQIAEFWAEVWDFVQIRSSRGYTEVVDDLRRMPGAHWFPGARLNFAENLLRYRDEQVALIFKGEGQPVRRMTYAGLFEAVCRVAHALEAMGVGPGDRVAGFMPNMPETIVAMLAATSLGATWSSCSPDFGIKGVLDRFGQIQPRVLFTADGYVFKGKRIDCLERIAAILKELPSVERVVVVPYTQPAPDLSQVPRAVGFEQFQGAGPVPEITFAQLPFEHPLYIMYSSGTTGLPKCMVQSAGGILIHHLKELVLHTDLTRADTIFYFTTCGWMMWNWLVSSLAAGATVVLYDGNPFHPDPSVLWRLAQDEKITVFGTSAGYLAALQASGLAPGEVFDLGPLRTLLSTGSPLSTEGFEFVYRCIKGDLQLASISGGTDLNGCFALGNPMAPVYAGELQCRGLGMKVEAFDEMGRSVVGQKGELVCTAPFPSMPIYFWNDDDGSKYRAAYFDLFPDVWRHGDWIEITERGGVVIYGRSDATLNPGGVRIGTAEIYRQMELVEEIEDCVVIGQDWKNDVRVILFVKLMPGRVLDEALKEKIRRTIRQNASPRHVPAKIIAVPDVPYTLNMKKVELAVRKMVHDLPVRNRDALRNPEVLEFFRDLPELRTD